MIYLKKFIILSAVAVLMPFAMVGAQAVQTVLPPICIVLNHDIYRGLTDSSTGGEVSGLQTFLNGQGYFPYQSIGIFGPLTLQAVQSFQSAHGVSATGYVGPITRGKIQELFCKVSPPSANAPTIQSISPTSGVVGTTVTIYGSGFTSDTKVLFGGGFGGVVASYNNSTSLSFVVPAYIGPNCPSGAMCPMYQTQSSQAMTSYLTRLITPGPYDISVQNVNGVSNSIIFNVTAGTTGGGGLSISGLDAPTQLSLGQVGTWTVHAVSQTQNGQQLSYSVVWGDEMVAYPMMTASSNVAVQSSATFTHTYSRAGTYVPVFTVTDQAGNKVTTSATVTVTPLY